MFDRKTGGHQNYNKYTTREVNILNTKVPLESDLTLYQMKYETNAKLIEALKSQHIFLSEHKDGPGPYRKRCLVGRTQYSPD